MTERRGRGFGRGYRSRPNHSTSANFRGGRGFGRGYGGEQNHNASANFRGGRGFGRGYVDGPNHNTRANFRGGRGGSRDGGHETYRQDETIVTLTIPEIIRSQQKTTIANFNSSTLTYKSSDGIIFITNGEPITTIWKKLLKKENPWGQNDVRMFVNSALVTADSQFDYKREELVKELGNPDSGLKRLKEIIEFPSVSCDAGLNNRVLSFQYVILPLFGLLTRNAIAECILEKYVHAIFMVIYVNLDTFFYNNVMKCLEMLVRRNSVVDHQVSVEELLKQNRYSFIPYSLGVFFLIIVRLLTSVRK
ncbi:hypothetical protein C1645_829115 [Glomus cerebriforme]|uniref:Uncharacterized protein n=1 Tax=Glomus cerebriforme TaxID=658196 RepID=A0A397SUZ4_9GLOM|nr:hypothetical protein C1645_829115 [Glomus cerebriforme]